MTISDGFAFGDYGGGILNDHGALTVSGCALTSNQATNGGGGLLNDAGTLTLRNSTFSGNSAAFGGGLYNRSIVSGTTATATVTNSTFSGNSATNSTQSNRYGGGILNAATSSGSATLTVLSSTLSGNSAANGLGGALHNRSTTGGTATVSLGSTLFNAGVPGSNVVNDMGTITSQGYNLSSDGPTGPYLTQPTDRTNTNPLIGALANNGGPTLTHALLASSPAIDTGKNFGLTTDQRGSPRPIDTIFRQCQRRRWQRHWRG